MELPNEKRNSNRSENTKPPSLKLLYGQNPTLSDNSLRELMTPCTRKKTDHSQTKQPQNQNNLAVSKNSEKMESCKKIWKPMDRNTDSFIAWSPRSMKIATEAYLARRNDSATKDEAPMQPNFDSSTKRIKLHKQPTVEKPNGQLTHISLRNPLENVEVFGVEECNPFVVENFYSPFDLNPSGEEDVKPSQSVPDSKSFRIIVGGIDITSEIKPERSRISYLNLCRAQDSLLHNGLIEGININYAVSVISETINISNAIKCSNMSTSLKEILYWGKALESMSTVGMNVGFLQDRVHRLLDLTTKAAMVLDRKKDEEAKAEGEELEEKLKAFELEIEKIREKKRKIDDEREGFRKKSEEFETMFRLVATAPW